MHRDEMRDLNLATKKEIMQVPLIGPVIAERLIASRPFKNWDAVKAVRLIGCQRVSNLREKFYISYSLAKAERNPEQEDFFVGSSVGSSNFSWTDVKTLEDSNNSGKSICHRSTMNARQGRRFREEDEFNVVAGATEVLLRSVFQAWSRQCIL